MSTLDWTICREPGPWPVSRVPGPTALFLPGKVQMVPGPPVQPGSCHFQLSLPPTLGEHDLVSNFLVSVHGEMISIPVPGVPGLLPTPSPSPGWAKRITPMGCPFSTPQPPSEAAPLAPLLHSCTGSCLQSSYLASVCVLSWGTAKGLEYDSRERQKALVTLGFHSGLTTLSRP